MAASEVASFILSACPSIADFELYMFGSSLRGVGEDIDILVVGPSGDTLAQLKKELGRAGEELPLHILHMLPSEAAETCFVGNEGCVALLELAGQK
ncbi:hypothetical protein G6L33_11145 [Agrobacterium rhizogenes]|nr:hypothetical protein [Rhizobium rhizogenes]NTH64407.1 hypothetical protein [Rhizobium rhizogenes]NTJ32087.1 hypothetical protein [Rhizobium rhizogenes]